MNGSVVSEVTEDDDKTQVAPSAENEEETDVSASEPAKSSGQRKEALLTAALGNALPISQPKYVPREDQSTSDSQPPYPNDDGIIEDVIQSSAKNKSPATRRNGDSDPIEPAEDPLNDPPRVKQAKRLEVVILSPRSPGMAMRMKNRSGRTTCDNSKLIVPITGTEAPDNGIAPHSQATNTGPKSAENNPSQDPASSNSVGAMPPSSAPVGKKSTKRVGRPPIPAEVKAAREKAEADEKARKAEEKIRIAKEKAEEKARKAAEEKARKEEEKARKAEEKARITQEKARTAAEEKARRAEEKAQKAAALPKKTTRKTSAKPSKASATTSIETAPAQSSTSDSSARDVQRRSPSMDKWATIPASSPQIPNSSLLVDQLRSSSPAPPLVTNDCQSGEGSIAKSQTVIDTTTEEAPVSVEQNDPLFFPSASQVPFPYSQWQEKIQGNDSLTESEDGDETPAGSKGTRNTFSVAPKYRRLTDIASQALFSQDIMSPTPPISTPSTNTSRDKWGEDSGDDDEDDDSGSDSDKEGKSHIPSSRRAATLRSRKGLGLLSYA